MNGPGLKTLILTRKQKPWRFEQVWLEDKGCHESVEAAWRSSLLLCFAPTFLCRPKVFIHFYFLCSLKVLRDYIFIIYFSLFNGCQDAHHIIWFFFSFFCSVQSSRPRLLCLRLRVTYYTLKKKTDYQSCGPRCCVRSNFNQFSHGENLRQTFPRCTYYTLKVRFGFLPPIFSIASEHSNDFLGSHSYSYMP